MRCICDNVFSALLLTAALICLFSRKRITAPRLCLPQCSFPRQYCSPQAICAACGLMPTSKNSAEKHPSRFCGCRILVSPEVDEVIRSLHRSSSEYPNQACSEQSATRSFYLLRTEKAITFDDILPIIRETLEKGISHIVYIQFRNPAPEAEPPCAPSAPPQLSLGA